MEKLSLEHGLSSNSPLDSTHNQATNFEDDDETNLNKLNIEETFETEKDNKNEQNILSDEDNIIFSDKEVLEKEKSPEDSVESPSESVDIEVKDANTTNCLALTIQEDHKLVAVKNVFIRSIRMSWKVIVSAVTLALIKLFT